MEWFFAVARLEIERMAGDDGKPIQHDAADGSVAATTAVVATPVPSVFAHLELPSSTALGYSSLLDTLTGCVAASHVQQITPEMANKARQAPREEEDGEGEGDGEDVEMSVREEKVEVESDVTTASATASAIDSMPSSLPATTSSTAAITQTVAVIPTLTPAITISSPSMMLDRWSPGSIASRVITIPSSTYDDIFIHGVAICLTHIIPSPADFTSWLATRYTISYHGMIYDYHQLMSYRHDMQLHIPMGVTGEQMTWEDPFLFIKLGFTSDMMVSSCPM